MIDSTQLVTSVPDPRGVSVTATDHALNPRDIEGGNFLPQGPGLVGDPGSSFANAVPGTDAQTAEEREQFGVNIYVYPNPATRDALAEYQELFPSPVLVPGELTVRRIAHQAGRTCNLLPDTVEHHAFDAGHGRRHPLVFFGQHLRSPGKICVQSHGRMFTSRAE